MKVVISSGHGKYVRGASGYIDEVDEARLVVEEVAKQLRAAGVETTTYHDNVSTSQNENLNRIVDFHNSKSRDLDISVHFNAYETTSKAMGTEVLYASNSGLERAEEVVDAIAGVGFINRGPKHRSDLFFLNNTEETAILIETCFCDSKADSDLYKDMFTDVCVAIAASVSGQEIPIEPGRPDIPERPSGPEIEPAPRETIAKGDTGPDVVELQSSLNVVEADGEFGGITDTWVRAFQAACGIAADGVVGPQTWEYVDDLNQRVKDSDTGLSEEKERQIVRLAHQSPLMDYSWPDRGRAPLGYIPGMALCFAATLELADPAVGVMSRAATGSGETDALVWYGDEFDALDMDNSRTGDATLRHLFVMLIGLGMRESSGRYCEGRDLSADNVEAETAEAGLFQTSWNIASAHKSIPSLLDDWWNNPVGFVDTFKEEVTATSNNLSCYGKGEGAKYQWLSRFAPLFHVIVTGVGLRTRRQHWGPINRKEVMLKREADELLKRVQELMSGGVV